MARVIAIVGAESTGKTTLASELEAALSTSGHRVARVGEYLREFCDVQGRTPRADEQAGIAAEQTRRIAEAATTHDIVIADTTALMIAVYSEMIFGDLSLYAQAEEAQRTYDINLLTATDIPWQADGLQRDGPHVQAPVTALVRASLWRAGMAYSVISGSGANRLAAALSAVRHIAPDSARDPDRPKWRWICAECGDGDCESHLLRSRRQEPPPR